jgi:hypothetical protein
MKVRKNGKNQLRKKNNHYERVATRNRIWREVKKTLSVVFQSNLI